MRPEDYKHGLTHDRLINVLSYDGKTGIFRWKIARPTNKIGDVAGSFAGRANDPYLCVNIDYHRYLLHRLAWFYIHKEWPVMLDHIDGVRTNNAIDNLRLATSRQNSQNKRVKKDNFLGIKGVRLHECGRFQARIYDGRRFRHLGLFDSSEEAALAYRNASVTLFGDFARI